MFERYKFNSQNFQIEQVVDTLELQRIFLDEQANIIDKAISLAEANKDQVLNRIRSIRDSILSKTDFTQAADAPLSLEQKEQWKTYRQALRDFPSSLSGIDLAYPQWPIDPNGWVPEVNVIPEIAESTEDILSSNVTSVTPGESVTFTIADSQQSSIEYIIVGVLESDITGVPLRGTLTTQDGSAELSVTIKEDYAFKYMTDESGTEVVLPSKMTFGIFSPNSPLQMKIISVDIVQA